MTGLAAACTSSSSTVQVSKPETPVPIATPLHSYVDTSGESGITALRCEECRAVEVTGVSGPETVVTPEGEFRLYGVFVAPEEENCVEDATARLTTLTSGTVRVEQGLIDTDAAGVPIRYLYTESGDSIDELFITEGIGRRSAFDGPHAPWLLVTADNARQNRAGCIWENFNNLFPGRTPGPSGGLN